MILASTASFIAQFNHRNIKILQHLGYEVHVAANFTHFGTSSSKSNQQFMQWLRVQHVVIHNVPIERRLGKFRQNISTLIILNHLMMKENYCFLHVHTPIASVLGRIVALKNHVPVIYTAHGFHFSKNSSKVNWFIFPIEWLLSFITDKLVLINQEDFLLARHYFHAKQIDYVPGVGVNFKLLGERQVDEHLLAKRELLKTLKLPTNSYLIIAVGELSKRKNHQVVVKALSILAMSNYHFVIAGRGKQRQALLRLATQLGVANQIHFLDYRRDIRHFHLAADLAVLPSLREGLSRAGLEAVRDGVYLLGSDIRGIRDYILNDEVGQVFNPRNANELAILIKKNIQRQKKGLSYSTVNRLMKFDRTAVDKQMKEIYQSMGE